MQVEASIGNVVMDPPEKPDTVNFAAHTSTSNHSPSDTANSEKGASPAPSDPLHGSQEPPQSNQPSPLTQPPLQESETNGNGTEDESSSSHTSETETDPSDRLTAEELLELGKKIKNAGSDQLDEAANTLSAALEKKQESVGPEDTSLARFYLEYADALLVKEESCSELFAGALQLRPTGKAAGAPVEQAASSSSAVVGQPAETLAPTANAEGIPAAESSTAGGGGDEEPTDEQQAWQMFEIARVFHTAALAEVDARGAGEEDKRLIEDAAFVHLRLGDMLSMQERYAEATQEYLNSLNVLRRYSVLLPERCQRGALVAYAQALFFSGRPSDALDAFKQSRAMLQQMLTEEQLPAGLSVEHLREFIEDLNIQVQELEAGIASGKFDNLPAPTDDSESSNEARRQQALRATGLSEVVCGKEENAFDAPTLPADTPAIDLTSVVKKKKKKKPTASTIATTVPEARQPEEETKPAEATTVRQPAEETKPAEATTVRQPAEETKAAEATTERLSTTGEELVRNVRLADEVDDEEERQLTKKRKLEE